MTTVQRLTVRGSEQRARLGEIGAMDDLTPEVRTELETLSAAHRDTESQLRAALLADVAAPPPAHALDSEARERLELRGRASFGKYLAAALTGGTISGAEAEYQAACKTPGIPLELFEQDRPEIRVDAASVAPATGSGATLAPIQPFVFSQSIAPLIGIEMPSVGSGSYSEMTISASLTAAAKAKGTVQDSTAAVLTPATATPRSIRGRLTLNLEDLAQIGQANFESALRQNAQAVVSDALDTQIISGNGTAPNLGGLISQLTAPTSPTDIATFDMFVGAFAGAIDGLWAPMMADVSMVTNVDAYKLAAKTFRGTAANGGPVETSADYLRKATGGFWTNKRMPATASTIARGIVYRKGRMGLRTACLPTWGSLAIDDIYSDAASGQRHFTLNVLVGSKVLLVQPAAYGLAVFKVA